MTEQWLILNQMNNWITQPKLFEHQNIDDITVLAYLDENTEVEVRAIIVNGFLVDMDLRGFPKSAFQSLEDDVRTALQYYGFKLAGRDSVEMDYFL